jgi:hypothetical protein
LGCPIFQAEVQLLPWEYPCWISPYAFLVLYSFVFWSFVVD